MYSLLLANELHEASSAHAAIKEYHIRNGATVSNAFKIEV